MPASTVLVVEDSALERENLRAIVEKAGYKVVTAENGREAVDKAKTFRPDVILMDVVMEEVDGFEACRKITSDQDTGKIPIYFVTSKNQRADRVWGELQGGKGMISKPYSSSDILATLSTVN